jgi:hypothetical protein
MKIFGFLFLGLCAFNATRVSAQNTTASPSESHLFGNQSITFYAAKGNAFYQNRISQALDEALKYDFPSKSPNTIVAPTVIGYQYQVKKRISIGMIYATSSVVTPNLDYPDFQNPDEITRFNLRVALNSFLGSVDYHWYIKNFKNSSLSLHSGIALGVFDVNFQTRVVSGNGQNLPQLNFSQGGSGWQCNLIGIKQSFNYKILKGLGYMANLGIGTNVIGMSYALTYTME